MEIYYAFLFFLFGLAFGSFYNVVGYRLPKKESIIYPRSHCTVCNHVLASYEMIPVLSFLFLRGRCRSCKTKIPWYYLFFELLTGILFALSYLFFGFTLSCLYSLVFVSILIVIMISDYKYYIIPNRVLIFGIVLLSILSFLIGGGFPNFQIEKAFSSLFSSLANGALSFAAMFLVKKIGDFLFKKESMGGGDIKLMFFIGMVLGFPLTLISIFLASLIGLPIALIYFLRNSSHIISFGPFLSVAAFLLFFSGWSWQQILLFIM